MTTRKKPGGSLSFLYFGQFDKSVNSRCKHNIQEVIASFGLDPVVRDAIVGAQDGGSPIRSPVVEHLRRIASAVCDELAASVDDPVTPAPLAEGLDPDGMLGFAYHLMHDPSIKARYSDDMEQAVRQFVEPGHSAFQAIVAYGDAFVGSEQDPAIRSHLDVIEQVLLAELQRAYRRFW